MAWRECKSLLQLKDQVNVTWPARDRSSDGTIGDQSHSQRKSDHNPNAAGVVTAMDIDRELVPDGSVTVAALVAKLQASRDARIKYLIWNAQITVPGDITKWKPYHGANAHKHHCHISVSSNPALYDDDSAWDLSGEAAESPEPPTLPNTSVRDLKLGNKGDAVCKLQAALKVTVDGNFGKHTRSAVINFQRDHKLDPDGIVGAKTWKALGL